MDNVDSIKEEYINDKAIYVSLEKVTNGLISTLISNEGLEIHSITSRCKTESSLTGKISRPEKNYQCLKDLTDIVGLRITTYFSDHVDLISDLIEREFVIDVGNSIDKRKAIEPDRFGYMSLHLVVEHSKTRTVLPEYEKFKGIKFEIQIRTILQHAWAEIEHDIGYKSSAQVPMNLRRRFSRLSGLLELADEEFLGIRNEITNYKHDLIDSIKLTPSSVTLDLDSIESFILSNDLVDNIENEFTLLFGCPLVKTNRETLSRFLLQINSLGINTIEELINSYEECKDYMIPFLELWLPMDDGSIPPFDNINRGISLLYVCYITLGLRNDAELFSKFMNSTKITAKLEVKNKIIEIFKDLQPQKK